MDIVGKRSKGLRIVMCRQELGQKGQLGMDDDSRGGERPLISGKAESGSHSGKEARNQLEKLEKQQQ